jgi:molybdopterin molybdotransferase
MSGLLSYTEAAEQVARYARELLSQSRGTERVELSEAAERVLAQAIVADEDQPAFARSTRDGFACRAVEAVTHAWMPVAGATHAGEPPPGPLPAGAFWEIMTGSPVPADADAVVMVEHIERDGDQVRLRAERTIQSGENVVARGAQARAGEILVPAGARMRMAQIAVAATCGYATVDVYRKPRVAILTTGDELVAVDADPGPGQIRNSNAPMLAALVAAAGGVPWVLPTAADTAEALDAALENAAAADLLLISGGVSAGKFDLVEPALERRGAKFFFTGVRIQPGKPLVFGALRATGPDAAGKENVSVPFLGLPGNPISSAATFRLFGAQVLAALSGSTELGPQFVAAQLAKSVKEKPGLTRFLPARCEFTNAYGGFPQVKTVDWNGSGDSPAFARANCFLVVPEDASSMDAGAMVRILML